MSYVPVRFHDGVVDYRWEEPAPSNDPDELLQRLRKAIALLNQDIHLPAALKSHCQIVDRFTEPFGPLVKAFEEIRELRRSQH